VSVRKRELTQPSLVNHLTTAPPPSSGSGLVVEVYRYHPRRGVTDSGVYRITDGALARREARRRHESTTSASHDIALVHVISCALIILSVAVAIAAVVLA
jgi:hypothetical protein